MGNFNRRRYHCGCHSHSPPREIKNIKTELEIALAGECRVGKTQFYNRLAEDTFNEEYLPALAPQMLIAKKKKSNYEITLNIWDFPGEEKYNPLNKIFYKRQIV